MGVTETLGRKRFGTELQKRPGGPLFVGDKVTVLRAENTPFLHVMSLFLMPDGQRGLMRGVTQRIGDVGKAGFYDISSLYFTTRNEDGSFRAHQEETKPKEFRPKGEQEIITRLAGSLDWKLTGKEDPTIHIDPQRNIHVYYTLVFRNENSGEFKSYLVHASGQDLDDLTMGEKLLDGAKEVSLVPINGRGYRLVPFEWWKKVEGQYFSTFATVKVAEAESLERDWKPLEHLVIDPAEDDVLPIWIRGHVSPGPHIPREILDLGERFVGMFLNGRGPNKITSGETEEFSPFTIGLCVYDLETGKVFAVSKEPIIEEPGANVTFASYLDTSTGRPILYAHSNDSSIDAYPLDAQKLSQYFHDFGNFMFLSNPFKD